MSRSEPGWELYRTFLEVMRGGSLSAAARALGLTQPTVGRHIDALERSLELSLFVRTQRGFSPTDAAQKLLPYAQTLAATSAALLRAASNPGDEVRGTVRVTASEVVAVEVLPPILAALRTSHPGLVIELVPSNRVEDLLRRDSDIAIRMIRPTQGSLVARHLGDTVLGLHAQQHYLDRHGLPRSIEELRDHTVIGFDRETAFTRGLTTQLPWLTRELFALRTDSDLAALAAVRAGVGIGICQLGLAQRDPGLVRLLPDQLSLRLETWLTLHEDLRSSSRCQIVFRALAEGLSQYLAGSQE